MKRTQFDIFCKMISSLGTAKVGDFTFVISQRPNKMFQLSQYHKGSTVTLKVGSHYDCVDAAKDCIKMMYDITD